MLLQNSAFLLVNQFDFKLSILICRIKFWLRILNNFRGFVCGNKLEGRKQPSPQCEEHAVPMPHASISPIVSPNYLHCVLTT